MRASNECKKCSELSGFNCKVQNVVEILALISKTINLDRTPPYPVIFCAGSSTL